MPTIRTYTVKIGYSSVVTVNKMDHARMEMRLVCLGIFVFVALTCIRQAQCNTIFVKWNSPSDGPGSDWDHAYHTVTAGLNAAVSGDSVWVAGDSTHAHHYVENITLQSGVALYGGYSGVGSARDIEVHETMLDGDQSGSVVTVAENASAATRIDGFTVTNGTAPIYWNQGSGQWAGGGILCAVGSSPVIANNLIFGNSAYNGGGAGIACFSGSPLIINNIISCNSGGGGCAISTESGTPLILNNEIAYNDGDGAIFCLYGSPTIANCLVTGTSGIGVWFISCSPDVVNCTIANNSADSGPGGIYCYEASPAIVNTILSGNSGTLGGCIGKVDAASNPTLSHCCIFNNGSQPFYPADWNPVSSGGNVSSDPLFVDSPLDYHLGPGSPCIDAGDNSVVQTGWTDLDGRSRIRPGSKAGSVVDIGCYESHAIVYVKWNSSSDGPGNDWNHAYHSVAGGLNAAFAGDEIRVAGDSSHTYHYTECVTLKTGVALCGGYSGSGDTRDAVTYEAVLDGNHTGNVVTSPFGATSSTSIDGFTITNGGAGIYCYQSSPSVTNNSLVHNDGGGIWCTTHSSPSIARNTLSQNSGGAINCYDGSSPVIASNLLTANTDPSKGAGIYCSSSSSPTITNNTIVGCSAGNSGGGIYCESASSPVVTNTVFSGNRAAYGGCIWRDATSNPVVAHCCAYDNGSQPFYPTSWNPVGSNGSFSADPLFVAAGSSDYHLNGGSPCVDAGDNSAVIPGGTDRDGRPRILPAGGSIDVGCYERGAGIVYVKWNSPEDGPGYDWEHAYRTVTAGINAAASGDQVRVAGDRTHIYHYIESITVKPGLALYGGYSGNGDFRDVGDYETTLDGNNGGAVVTSPAGATASTVIDGLTIENGQGVYCYQSSPTIANNKISQNYHGIYCEQSSPVITNNSISQNTGGGIWCVNSSSPTIRGNDVSQNSGGGINCSSSSSPTIANNQISGNTDPSIGAGIYCSTSCSPAITNNVIVGSSTGNNGGGIYCSSSSSPIITNNTIVGSTAGSSGGAIYCVTSSSPTVTNNIFSGNQAPSGGCIWKDATSNPIVTHCCVFSNGGQPFYPTSWNPVGLNSNLSSDPLFAGSSDYHLRSSSACIDAGDNSAVQIGWTDLDGRLRILPDGGLVDMGCYEWRSPILVMWNSPYDGPGNDWNHAYHTVTGALNAAFSGDEAHVAGDSSHTYHYSECVTLKSGVRLYGGYAGLGDTRDVKTYESVLDGNHAGSVVTSPLGITAATLIDGFTITGGIGAPTGKRTAKCGGAIRCYYSSPSISNNTITGNSGDAGAGIYSYNGSPSITDCTISSNTGSGLEGQGGPEGVWFSQSGAIYCEGGSANVSNNVINNNQGGGICCFGGAPSITGNRIVGNYNGSGIYMGSYSTAVITNNLITANSAPYYGGGICSAWCTPNISDNIVDWNTASEGGGIYWIGLQGTLANNLITGNSASSSGGGVYCTEVYELDIVNNTISGNTAGWSGGGLCCDSFASSSVTNSILSGNRAFAGGSIYRYPDSTVTVSHCCVFDNDTQPFSPVDWNPIGANGNFSSDPFFVAAGTGDDHLAPGSPCIDSGDNSLVQPGWTDLDSSPRIANGTVDIGAFEYGSTGPVANDSCGSATVIISFPYSDVKDTTRASSAGDPMPSCSATSKLGVRRSSEQFGNGLWYRYTPIADCTITLDTNGSNYDTVLAVYTGGCNSLREIACSDDVSASNTTSFLTTPLTGGVTYYFLVASYYRGGGQLIFHANAAVVPPPNDACINAISINGYHIDDTQNTSGAQSGGDPVPSCASNFGKGIWYKLVTGDVAPVGVLVTAEGSALNGGIPCMQAFMGGCGSLDPLGGLCSKGTAASLYFQALGNTTYYLLVGGCNMASGTLRLRVLRWDAAPPAIDGFSPTTGLPGSPVLIYGPGGFLGAQSVTFNGVPADFIIDSASQITAYVPAGATAGPISVSNMKGTAQRSDLIFSPVTNYTATQSYLLDYTNSGGVQWTWLEEDTQSASGTGGPTPPCISGFGKGVWFLLHGSSTFDTRVTVNTFGSDFETGLADYTGTGGPQTVDQCGTSSLDFTVLQNSTAWLLVGGKNGASGHLRLHVGMTVVDRHICSVCLVNPGNGNLTPGRNYVVGNGAVGIDVAGTSTNSYGCLSLGYPITLEGTALTVNLKNGFQPVPGESFDIIVVRGSISGDFKTVNVSPSPTGMAFGTAVVTSSDQACQIYRVTPQSAVAASSTGLARTAPNGTPVYLFNKVVSAAHSDYVSVQEPDRSSGIRVNVPGSGLVPGDFVNVFGQMGCALSNGANCLERQVTSAGVWKVNSGSPPAPLGVTCSQIGGAALGSYTLPVGGGIGLCNVGLLVRIVGHVNYKDAGGTYIAIDDSSAIPDPTGSSGVLVQLPAARPDVVVGTFVEVTGVVEAYSSASPTRRFVRPRTAEDVKTSADLGWH